MEQAKYYPQGGNPNNPLKEIKRQITQINWDNRNTITGIPSKGHRVVELFKMLQPGDMNEPNSNNKTPPHYVFAGVGEEESMPGTWEIRYCIFCKNGNVSRFKITVLWLGEWKSRLKEMSSIVEVNAEML